MILKVNNLTKSFGGLVAIKNVTFGVSPGEILGLIGPNGAGKTTLLNLICGIYRPDRGAIMFKNENLTTLKPHQICRRGISRTLQIPHAFPELTTVENVVLPILFLRKGLGKDKAIQEAEEVLGFIGFPEAKYHIPASQLNALELKYLQLAKALACKPEVLLLDEVTTGLNPAESKKAIELIKKIQDKEITMILVEHVMRIVMSVCDRIIVLSSGTIIADGKPEEITKNKLVIRSYLGEKFKV